MSIEGIIGIATGVVGFIGAVLGLYFKYSPKIKEKKRKKLKREETIDRLPEMFNYLHLKIDDLVNTQENLQEDVNDVKNAQSKFEFHFDQFETQELRYMINDSFFGYRSIQDVPDEQLYIASECCDIYLAKGLNHATGAKCKIIAAEIERRQRERAEGDHHGN